MKITIDIPKEYEGDFTSDKFEDFFERAIGDMNGDGMGGKYEQETAKMLLKAFQNAKVMEENVLDNLAINKFLNQCAVLRVNTQKELNQLCDYIESRTDNQIIVSNTDKMYDSYFPYYVIGKQNHELRLNSVHSVGIAEITALKLKNNELFRFSDIIPSLEFKKEDKLDMFLKGKAVIACYNQNSFDHLIQYIQLKAPDVEISSNDFLPNFRFFAIGKTTFGDLFLTGLPNTKVAPAVHVYDPEMYVYSDVRKEIEDAIFARSEKTDDIFSRFINNYFEFSNDLEQEESDLEEEK